MRDADKRQQMAEDIRKRVKIVTDRERRDRALRSRRAKLEGSHSSSGSPKPHYSTQDFPTSVEKAIINHSPTLVKDVSLINSLPSASSYLSIQARLQEGGYLEYVLLMSYLDDVVPYHFPFYRPSRGEGGRAWLLCLLMRSKPLYKAALAIAAVYLQKSPPDFAVSGAYGLSSSDINVHAEELYIGALDALQASIKRLSKKTNEDGLIEGIEVLASVVHLIILEVCTTVLLAE
jgi:hypothetical protein